MINIDIKDDSLRKALDGLKSKISDMRPIMRHFAAILENETERNFENNGRPKWPSLSRSTLEKRVLKSAKGKFRKDGRIGKSTANAVSSIKILQDTGQLAGSITSNFSNTFAIVGTGKDNYAAIHQFGGKAGRGKKVTIPARPYLPILANGSLQPAAQKSILDAALDYLGKAVK